MKEEELFKMRFEFLVGCLTGYLSEVLDKESVGFVVLNEELNKILKLSKSTTKESLKVDKHA